MKFLPLLLLFLFPGSAQASEYIIETAPGRSDSVIRAFSLEPTHRYAAAFSGFSAKLNAAELRRLRASRGVVGIYPSRRRWQIADWQTNLPGELLPSGIARLGAATSTYSGSSAAPVAVIDTGIDLRHPDLDARDGVNCVERGKPAQDRQSHGTHVAGTIGARNNGSGVLGIAPGTPVYAVKVLDDWGLGSDADIICGIDWLARKAGELGIRVANMSLGGIEEENPSVPCAKSRSPMRRAICRASERDILFVVAAGNYGDDFDKGNYFAPAAYPETLAVTALTDKDGRPNKSGRTYCGSRWNAEDGPAPFSNWSATESGRSRTLAAPGVCVRSTLPGGRYGQKSGTSMASPHVAGIASLCLQGMCAGKNPAERIRVLRDASLAARSAYPGWSYRDARINRFGPLVVNPGGGGIDPLDPFYSYQINNQPAQTKVMRWDFDRGGRFLILSVRGYLQNSPLQALYNFRCRLSGKKTWAGWGKCETMFTSGARSLVVLPLGKPVRGRYLLRVAALGEDGRLDPSPASIRFRVK